MLHHLIKYAETHSFDAESGFSPKEVRWAIACDASAHFTETIPLGEGKTGRSFARRPDLARNRNFALTLSGAAGRVMVRDWMEGAFEDLVRNVHAWFEDLSVTRLLPHSVTVLPPIERVITCLLAPRNPSQEYSDWVKPIGPARKALFDSAVTGAPIPTQLIPRLSMRVNTFFQSRELEAALDKDRNLGPVLALLYARMGLIKAFHIRKPKGGIPMSPYLNEDHPDPAYHCGQLLAVLAGLQRSALGDVGLAWFSGTTPRHAKRRPS